jgi:hypothetical protein
MTDVAALATSNTRLLANPGALTSEPPHDTAATHWRL